MAHTALITRAEAPRYGIPADFLAQFDVRPIQVLVETAGALGTATFSWRRLGDSDYSAEVTSSPASTWEWSPAGSFAVLTFAPGTYVVDSTYTIDEDGTVTRSGSAINTVTATRFDVVEDKIAEVTDEATDDMQPRYMLPLLEWGAAVKGHAAAWLKYLLKDYLGFAPAGQNPGDQQIADAWMAAREYFRRQGSGQKKSPDIVDSSSTGTGAGLMASVASDEKAGWD